MFVNGQAAERILPAIAGEYPFQIMLLGACEIPADVSRIRSLIAMEFKIQAIHPECDTPCKGCLHELVTALRNGVVVALAAQDEQTLRRWHRMVILWMAEAV